jgi:hypothetical protein
VGSELVCRRGELVSQVKQHEEGTTAKEESGS